MALGSLLGLIGSAVAKSTTNKPKTTATTKTNSNTNKKLPTKNSASDSFFTSPTTYQNMLGGNEHANYINQTYSGGLDSYTKLQNDRYANALKNNDVDLLNRLNADAQKVGYSLNAPQQVQPPQLVMPELDMPSYKPFNYQDFNYKDFNYNVNNDELYNKYAEMFARQGQSASEQALAGASAATGGIPSSYAAAVNSQAQQAYAKKAADMVPTLERYAYDKYANDRNFNYQNYLNEFNTAFQDHTNKYNYDANNAQAEYNSLINKANAEYNAGWDGVKYQDSRSDLAYDREKQQETFDYQKYLNQLDEEYRQSNFAWNKETDQRDFNYGANQDSIRNSLSWDDNARQWEQFNYGKSKDELAKQEKESEKLKEKQLEEKMLTEQKESEQTVRVAVADALKASNPSEWLKLNASYMTNAEYDAVVKRLKDLKALGGYEEE